jgi:hypothetical protein
LFVDVYLFCPADIITVLSHSGIIAAARCGIKGKGKSGSRCFFFPAVPDGGLTLF